MSDSFRLRVRGGSEIEAFFDRLSGRVDDMMPLFEMIGAQLESSTADNFKGEHDPSGVPWQPSRRARETGGKTLTDTRILANSIGYKASQTSVEVGTNVIYARPHNQGWSGSEMVRAHERAMTHAFGVKLSKPHEVMVGAFSRHAKTPKRQFLGVGPGDEQDIVGIMQDYFGMGEH